MWPFVHRREEDGLSCNREFVGSRFCCIAQLIFEMLWFGVRLLQIDQGIPTPTPRPIPLKLIALVSGAVALIAVIQNRTIN
jgi:hypothetical protein